MDRHPGALRVGSDRLEPLPSLDDDLGASMVKWRQTLQESIALLLSDVCTKWGLCTCLSGVEIVDEHPIVTASIFADAVLAAEGMDPAVEKHWRGLLSQRFIEWHGGERLCEDALSDSVAVAPPPPIGRFSIVDDTILRSASLGA